MMAVSFSEQRRLGAGGSTPSPAPLRGGCRRRAGREAARGLAGWPASCCCCCVGAAPKMPWKGRLACGQAVSCLLDRLQLDFQAALCARK